MTLIFNNKIKATFLLFGLLLIGGFGCVTMAVIEATQEGIVSAEHAKAAAEYHLSQQQYFKNVEALAAKGDAQAETIMGIEYFNDSLYVTTDHKKGHALLNDAIKQSYAPAEYFVGVQLVQDLNTVYRWRKSDNIQYLLDVYPLDINRGIDLLKKSAQHQCVISYALDEGGNKPTKSYTFIEHPASKLSNLYQGDKYSGIDTTLFPANKAESQLWLARSIVHCNYPDEPSTTSGWRDDSVQIRNIDSMAFMLLAAPENWRSDYARVQSKLSPEEQLAAENKAIFLRKAIAESEKKYPAPIFSLSEKEKIITRGDRLLEDNFQTAIRRLGENKPFMATTQSFVKYSWFLHDHASLMAHYSSAIMGKNLVVSTGQSVTRERLQSAEEIFNHYTSNIFPYTGKDEKGEYLHVASMGLILAVATKKSKTSHVIFDKLLGGKAFNINAQTDINLIYNLACYYAANHKKPELLVAAKKLVEVSNKADELFVDPDVKDYVADKDFLTVLKRI